MKAYAAYYDNVIRSQSSSGGVFSLLASHFDVIYGVEMDKDNLYAIYARKEGDISSLRGSKYLQARVGNIYNQVKKDLNLGKTVLFSGTACQVNGLYAFLGKEYSSLITIDIICHGVPSPKYWHKFIEGKTVNNINFRSKDGGWDRYSCGMTLNQEYISNTKNKFMILYVENYPLRPSCYECVCKSNKKSDITLGDFWGIWNSHPEMTDNKGTSVVIVRSDKGQKLFDKIKSELVWKEVSYDDAVKQNTSEYQSTVRPIHRENFFKDLEKMSFEKIYKKYVSFPEIKQRYYGKAKQVINTFLGRR